MHLVYSLNIFLNVLGPSKWRIIVPFHIFERHAVVIFSGSKTRRRVQKYFYVESLNCRCWSCSSLLSPVHVLVTTLIHQPGLAVHHRAKKHPFFRRYLWMEAYDNNPSWKPDVVTQTDGRYWAVLMISQRHSRSVPFLDFLERNMKWCRYITFLLLIHFSILFKLSR